MNADREEGCRDTGASAVARHCSHRKTSE